ncbi:unnamed protein product [Vitrella brassicaformis CCMP3155]|uniref:SS18 N-terminal domain-containing protein n=1 Tax=Vitrella brassicaformis (strain CCMP3155) TaxID=1169540 RepID=A0A0G4FFR5_VITBC|nr:unnamed protein product [Vitrella brassicaformis CCMP3155]|mmetsp:Transcript_26594/g.66144  ORF Transcript_26594/g.66144 Transcript_26594/m.66144 type:complete len:201 (-) Transcript_26594:184-786(-)|eukprot:CEM11887.1 unnamed protein product [Vitrella brassicaformis CCMP3155]
MKEEKQKSPQAVGDALAAVKVEIQKKMEENVRLLEAIQHARQRGGGRQETLGYLERLNHNLFYLALVADQAPPLPPREHPPPVTPATSSAGQSQAPSSVPDMASHHHHHHQQVAMMPPSASAAASMAQPQPAPQRGAWTPQEVASLNNAIGRGVQPNNYAALSSMIGTKSAMEVHAFIQTQTAKQRAPSADGAPPQAHPI